MRGRISSWFAPLQVPGAATSQITTWFHSQVILQTSLVRLPPFVIPTMHGLTLFSIFFNSDQYNTSFLWVIRLLNHHHLFPCGSLLGEITVGKSGLSRSFCFWGLEILFSIYGWGLERQDLASPRPPLLATALIRLAQNLGSRCKYYPRMGFTDERRYNVEFIRKLPSGWSGEVEGGLCHSLNCPHLAILCRTVWNVQGDAEPLFNWLCVITSDERHQIIRLSKGNSLINQSITRLRDNEREEDLIALIKVNKLYSPNPPVASPWRLP